MAYMHQIETVDVTIANGQSLSGAADVGGKAVVAVITPSAWTAAALTFRKSADGASYYPVYDKSAEVSIASSVIATGEARWFDLDPTMFAGATSIKVQSGLNGAAVNQGAQRTVTLVLKPI